LPGVSRSFFSQQLENDDGGSVRIDDFQTEPQKQNASTISEGLQYKFRERPHGVATGSGSLLRTIDAQPFEAAEEL